MNEVELLKICILTFLLLKLSTFHLLKSCIFLTVYKGSLYIKDINAFSLMFVENIFLISC